MAVESGLMAATIGPKEPHSFPIDNFDRAPRATVPGTERSRRLL
jgi:hypothetical protein